MADQNVIEVSGGVREQGTDETAKIWSIDVVDVTATPASPEIVDAHSEADPATDVSDTIFTGSPTVATTIITLPALDGSELTVNTMYRVYVTFTSGGNTHVVFFRLWVSERSTAKALVTVPMCLEYMETDVPGSQIFRLIEDGDAEVVRVAGAHPLAGDRTEELVGSEPLLFLPAPALTLTSVTEWDDFIFTGGTSTLLSADDYRSWEGGRFLQRLNDGTNPRTRWAPRGR